jgi:hypothetical protein
VRWGVTPPTKREEGVLALPEPSPEHGRSEHAELGTAAGACNQSVKRRCVALLRCSYAQMETAGSHSLPRVAESAGFREGEALRRYVLPAAVEEDGSAEVCMGCALLG